MALSYGAAYAATPTLPSAPVIIVSGRDPRRVGFPLDLHTLPEHGKISYCGIRPGDTNSRCGVLYFGVLIVFSCGGCRCHPCTHRSTSSCSSRRPLMLRCSLVVWLFLPSFISHSPRQSYPALWWCKLPLFLFWLLDLYFHVRHAG